jgi:hypothetical protein
MVFELSSSIHGLKLSSINNPFKSIGSPDGNIVTEHIIKVLTKNDNFSIVIGKIIFGELK